MNHTPQRFVDSSLGKLLHVFAFLLVLSQPLSAQQSREFVVAKGDKLFVGEREFRFMTFNIPNLHLVEDNFSLTNSSPWRWPNEFEIRDALESIRQMGGTATRIYVLSVKREGSDMGDHVYVHGPGEFNETAFRVLDKVLEVANEKNVRVVIPLVDNWHWWGGRAEYAKFRGKQPDDFWTDEQLIEDFKQTIAFTLNRINTFTGVAYKDDPAILGWETGNELDSTPEWTRQIAAYIKQIDSNHLVIDGYALHGVRQESLDDPNIDVITTHHYPNTDKDYVAAISQAHKMTAGEKPYFVGEFGFVSPERLERVMDTIIENGISGGMLWSLRFHNRDGGFYWHSEPSGENLYKAYHWPGFASGDPYFERRILDLTRRKAFEIRGMPIPKRTPPSAPQLLPIAEVSAISWQGSAGASRYDIERAPTKHGPWQIVGSDVSDAAVQYRPLFSDMTANTGNSYFYRVLAKNSGSISKPSNVVGPVPVHHQTLVDECRDFAMLHQRSDGVTIESLQARKTQEDIHRFRLQEKESIVYRVDEPIQGFRIVLYHDGVTSSPTVSSSIDGEEFVNCTYDRESMAIGSGDYGYLRPLVINGSPADAQAQYLKIEAPSTENETQLSRIEIQHGPRTHAADEANIGAQLNPSILLFHKPYHTEGVKYVRRAAALGFKKVNLVITLLCDIDGKSKVRRFGVRSGRKFRPLNDKLLAKFKQDVKNVVAEIAANDMELAILAHLNAGGRNYDWRNNFLFDPLSYYDGFSYNETLISAIQDAIVATENLRAPIDIALAGEMGRSVFAYPDSYAAIAKSLQSDRRLASVNIGISLNFNNAAGEEEVDHARQQAAQELVDQLDFVGISNYRPIRLPIDARHFEQAKLDFLTDMRKSGVTLPKNMPLHFSEVGIGGGTEDGLAENPSEAATTPWHGSDNSKRNPWASAEMRQFRVDYHQALLSFLAKHSQTNPVTDAYLWSEGSWDPLDTTDQGFKDERIIKMIREHNRSVRSEND